eukprot:4208532-Karenia_brevis.AAC.1
MKVNRRWSISDRELFCRQNAGDNHTRTRTSTHSGTQTQDTQAHTHARAHIHTPAKGQEANKQQFREM